MKLFLSSLLGSEVVVPPEPTYSPTQIAFKGVTKDSADTEWRMDFNTSLTIEFEVKAGAVKNILHQSDTNGVISAFSVGDEFTSLVKFRSAQFGNKADLLDNTWHKCVIYYNSATSTARLYIDDVYKAQGTGISYVPNMRYSFQINSNNKGTSEPGDMNLKYLRFYRGDYTDLELTNLDPTTAFKRFEFTTYNAWKMVDTGTSVDKFDGFFDKIGDVNEMWVNDAGEQQAPTDFKYLVIPIVGQSNTYYGFREREFTNYEPISRVKQVGRFAPDIDNIIEGSDPIQAYQYPANGGISHDTQYSKMLVDNGIINEYDQIVLIACSWGGSGFINDFWNPGDAHYEEFIAKVNLFFTNHPNSELYSVNWHGGESDITLGESTYITKMTAFIDGWRSDLTAASSTTPFIMGSMVKLWMDANPTAYDIDSAQRAIAGGLRSNCYFGDGQSPFVIPKINISTGDELIHYDADGQIELANRYFYAKNGATVVPDMTMQTPLTSANITSNSIDISINVSGATGYYVFISEAFYETVNQVSLSNYTISGLTSGFNYRLSVKAFNSNGKSVYSNLIPFTTL